MAISLSVYDIPTFSKPLEGISPRGTESTGRTQAVVRIDARLVDGRFKSQPETPKPIWPGTVLSGNNSCLDHPIYSIKKPGYRRGFQGRILLKAVDGVTSMFSLQLLRDACEFEKKYVIKHRKHKGKCDWSQSLYLYVTMGVAGVPLNSCNDIAQTHVDDTLALVERCMPDYEAGRLAPDCTGNCSASVQSECTKHNMVYKIVHFLSDSTFMSGTPRSKNVVESLLFLRDEWFETKEDEMRDFFIDVLDKKKIDHGSVQMRAVEVNSFDKVLAVYTIYDLVFFGLSMVMILIMLYIYLRSITMMIATVTNVSFAICSSYFFFFAIYQLDFFPFMNIVAGLLVIAIGADGVFILFDLKEEAKRDNPDMDMVEICEIMLRHGGLSIAITSLTTAAAVFTNFASNITSLRCFGIFGGTCVLMNLLFLMSFVPAVIMMLEKYYYVGPCMCCCVDKEEAIIKFEKEKGVVKWVKFNKCLNQFWKELIPRYITKLAPINILICSIIGIGGIVLTYAAPTLKVQEYRDFQIFPMFNMMETYRWDYRDKFRFEQEANIKERSMMDMQFIWGFDGADKGDLLDPNSKGELELEDRFYFYATQSQQFIKAFCQKSKKESFIRDPNSLQCFMDIVKEIYETPCRTGMQSQCCNNPGRFPMSPSVAEFCYKKENIPKEVSSRVSAGKQLIGQIIYENGTNKLIGFRIRLPTIYNWTNDFGDMKEVVGELKDYQKRMLKDVKGNGLELGWFSGSDEFDLDLYDLQNSLSSGMFMGILMSVSLGFIVLLITSLNIIITIYSIVTIILTIGGTMGSLVIMGWQVTLFDSIVISLAVGLSIDFSIHYGIGYKLAHGDNSVDRVQYVIKTIGSAVAMAAVTTFGAGTMCYFGYSVVYTHFGTFLMVVMLFAWSFGTFFFLGILSIIGPDRGTGEIPTNCKSGSSSSVNITTGQDNSAYVNGEGRIQGNDAPHKNTHEMSENITKNKVSPDIEDESPPGYDAKSEMA